MKKIAKTTLTFILGILLAFAIDVAAEVVIDSGAVNYSNSKTNETTVSGALDELFSAVDINERIGSTDISSIGDGTITGVIATQQEQIDEQNSIISSLRKRVGYIDYSGEDGDGYRINFPQNANFTGLNYVAVDIGWAIPDGYVIDPDFPTIQCTINTSNVMYGVKNCSYYHGTALLIELTGNYTGQLGFAIGVRLRKIS